MNVSSNAKVIQGATRELARKWDQTKESWRDAKSEEFEQTYLIELFSAVDRCIPLLEELDRLMGNARRQCE